MSLTLNQTNNSTSSYVDDGGGKKWSADPRATCYQQPVQRYPGGQVVTYQQTLSPALIAGSTAAEQSLTIGTTAGNGPATTDLILAVNKPTNAAGIGVHSARISAANTIYLTYSNTTGGNLTPAPSQVYNVTVIRGAIYNSQTLTPTAVSANNTSEQEFTIAPTSATITLTINAIDGGIDAATIASGNGGTGYYRCPSVLVVDNGGRDAVIRVDVNTSGVCTQAKVLRRGKGYTQTATASVIGGNTIEKGMFPFVIKPSCDAGVAISNVRISGKNKIAIQYVNPTAAAVTPTSEAYKIICLNDIPSISNLTSYGVPFTGLASVASITTAEQSVTISGLLATDIMVGVQKPSLNAGLAATGGRCAANAMYVTFVNPSAAAVTPTATDIYMVTVYNQSPIAPFKIYSALFTPVSVAANLTAEQAFTVTGLPCTNSSPATIQVSKPSHQTGLAIAGCRISASDTMYINYENVTSAAITPASETYLIGCFNGIPPISGVPGGWIALPFSQTLQHIVESENDMGDTMILNAMEAGA